MITERQQFHLEQLKAAEFRARQQAHQRLQQEQGQWAPNPNLPPGAAAVVPPTTISAQGRFILQKKTNKEINFFFFIC